MSSKPFQHNPGSSSNRSPPYKQHPPAANQLNTSTGYVHGVYSPKNKTFHSANFQEHEQLNLVHKENTILREQNRVLRKQLSIMRNQYFLPKQNEAEAQVNDLRETIKKQTGEIKDLKNRLEVLSKQCKVYEEIIDKMQGKLVKLNETNKILEQRLNQSRIRERIGQDGPGGLRKTLDGERIAPLRNKVNEIIVLYTELEAKVQSSEQEWQTWKEQWSKQKTYYLNRIRDLQSLMGIGSEPKSESKQFFKKRQQS